MKIQILLLLAVMAVAGCADSTNTGDDQMLIQHRSAFVLSDEPDQILGITDLRTMLEEPDDVTVSADVANDSGTHEAESHDHEGHGDGAHGPDEDVHDEHSDGHDDSAKASEEEHGHAHHADGEEDHVGHDHSSPVTGLGSKAGVAVVGKISAESAGGGADASDFPWEKGMAAFVMIDPAIEADEPEHQHKEGEECPFCTKKKIEAQAIIQFNDGDGQTIAVDARDLFELSVDDIVIVTGDAALKGGVLIIEADGIHVRR